MSEPTPLEMVQGEPLDLVATVTDGVTFWPGGMQVRGQVRTAPGGDLMLDLTPYLTTTVSTENPQDLRIDMRLTGSATRKVFRPGFYDVYVSEPGVIEANAVRVLFGPVDVEMAVTTAPAA